MFESRPKIHVMQVLEATGGGTRRHLFELMDRLDKERFQLTFVYADRGEEGFDDELAILRDQGVRLVHVPMKRRPAPVADLCACYRIATLLAELQPHVLHTHSSKAGMIGRLAASFVSVPVVVHTPHAFPYQMPLLPPFRWTYRFLEKHLAGLSNVLVCVSQEEVRSAVDAGIAAPDKLVYIPNGVDTRKPLPDVKASQRLRESAGIPEHAPLLVSVGRLQKQKGYDRLFPVLARVRSMFPSVRCVVVGHGKQEKRLRRRARKAGLEECLHFAGYRHDPQTWMAAADVYFQLSRYEGMPYTILDAMRLQRPVVAFDAGGIRDVVLNKETGFLIRQGDVEGAAEAICALLQNGNMRLEMGLKAVRRVDSVFSLSMAVLELQRLYEQSVGEVLAQR